jgi:hypothetical protein
MDLHNDSWILQNGHVDFAECRVGNILVLATTQFWSRDLIEPLHSVGQSEPAP